MDIIDQDSTAQRFTPDAHETEPTRPAAKRRYSKALKRQMVEATLTGKESVSMVARRYDVNANQLFKWRRQYREGLLEDKSTPATLMPIELARPGPPSRVHATATTTPKPGSLEIVLTGGHRIVMSGTVCPVTLQATLEILSR